MTTRKMDTRGAHPMGKSNRHIRRLTDCQVRYVRRQAKAGATQKAIWEELKKAGTYISSPTISQVVNHIRYADVTDDGPASPDPKGGEA